MSNTAVPEKLVIFGYGSILWKQNFPFVRQHRGYITGYKRVFFQGSTDHRGVPGDPGRVATLIPWGPQHSRGTVASGSVGSHCPASGTPTETARVYGVAFEIAPQDNDTVLSALDIRERGGYDRVQVLFYDAATNEPLDTPCVCYIANESNEEYLGEASEEEIARNIFRCNGMSGSNTEYLLNLVDSLRAMGAVDDHVFGIERELRKLMSAAAPERS